MILRALFWVVWRVLRWVLDRSGAHAGLAPVVWAIACIDVMAGKLEMALFWALTRPWRDQATRGTLKAVFCGTRYDLDEYDKYIKFKYAWRSN